MWIGANSFDMLRQSFQNGNVPLWFQCVRRDMVYIGLISYVSHGTNIWFKLILRHFATLPKTFCALQTSLVSEKSTSWVVVLLPSRVLKPFRSHKEAFEIQKKKRREVPISKAGEVRKDLSKHVQMKWRSSCQMIPKMSSNHKSREDYIGTIKNRSHHFVWL